MTRNAIIMAAGMSSRFAPLSLETPKALLNVKDEIMIERQIGQLREAGIDEIVIVVGYLKEKFEYLKEKYHSGFYRLNTPNFSVSSRELRERIMRGTTIRYMLPPQAEQYIRDHALYREDFA